MIGELLLIIRGVDHPYQGTQEINPMNAIPLLVVAKGIDQGIIPVIIPVSKMQMAENMDITAVQILDQVEVVTQAGLHPETWLKKQTVQQVMVYENRGGGSHLLIQEGWCACLCLLLRYAE